MRCTACDTKLHRDVALKILPDVFAADPERLERFEREAHLLASLNHPNIAAIYAFETGPGDPLRQGYGGPPKLHAEAEAGPHVQSIGPV